MTIDLGVAYGAARSRVSALVSAASVPSDLVVPATPDWTVHDVVAHLSGIAVDGTTGNMEGAPGDAWTAAQVARNAHRSIAEMIEEWGETGPFMEAFLSSPAGQQASAAVMDIHTHEADLRHALGLPIEVPEDFLSWAGDVMRDGFQSQLAESGLAPVQLEASDFEWFRGRLGRRTAAEVVALGIPEPHEPYLDAFFIFGRAQVSLGEPS